MKIFTQNGVIASVVIVPREFQPVPGAVDSLEVVSHEIQEVLEESGLHFIPPLMLNVCFADAFCGKRLCFLFAETRHASLWDRLTKKGDAYGILPVLLSAKELIMLYGLVYPGKKPDEELISTILSDQMEVFSAVE